MGCVNTFRDLNGNSQRFFERESSSIERFRKRLAIDEFQCDKALPLDFACFIYLADEWVIDRGSAFRFHQKSCTNVRPLHRCLGKEFEGNLANEDHVLGEEDFSAATLPEFPQNPIMGKGAANQHCLPVYADSH